MQAVDIHAVAIGEATGRFEFAVVAALRAKQLMAGCVPRVLPARKFTSTASLEVRAGKVARVPDGSVWGPPSS